MVTPGGRQASALRDIGMKFRPSRHARGHQGRYEADPEPAVSDRYAAVRDAWVVTVTSREAGTGIWTRKLVN
jgi:hypothetical protein